MHHQEAKYMSANNCPSILRWKIGHRLFFFITQGLIVVHHDIRNCIATKKYQEALKVMELAMDLFNASIEAFNFSSGYAKSEYEVSVRPSMAPPHFETLLSGTEYIDHTEMLKQIKSCREFFQDLPEELKPTYEKYIATIKKVYCNHSKICSRIVGDHKAEPAKIREQYMTRTLKYAGVHEVTS